MVKLLYIIIGLGFFSYFPIAYFVGATSTSNTFLGIVVFGVLVDIYKRYKGEEPYKERIYQAIVILIILGQAYTFMFAGLQS